jgi:hypothetical protein
MIHSSIITRALNPFHNYSFPGGRWEYFQDEQHTIGQSQETPLMKQKKKIPRLIISTFHSKFEMNDSAKFSSLCTEEFCVYACRSTCWHPPVQQVLPNAVLQLNKNKTAKSLLCCWLHIIILFFGFVWSSGSTSHLHFPYQIPPPAVQPFFKIP